MAWPPHEDETLALFVGRDSLPGVVEHVHARAWRRATPLPPRVGGRAPRLRAGRPADRLRRVRAREPAARRAARPPSRRCRESGSWRRRSRVQLALPVPRCLRPHVQPVPLLLARLHARAADGARARRSGRWALWVLDGAAHGRDPSLRHPPARGAGGVRPPRARHRLREATLAGRSRARAGHPVLAHRPRPRGPLRRRGRGRRREARRPVCRRALPLALRGGRERGLVAGHARRSSRAAGPAWCSSAARRGRSSSASSACAVAAFMLARIGGSASPESRHLSSSLRSSRSRSRRRSSASAAAPRCSPSRVTGSPRRSTSHGRGTGHRRSSSGSRTRDRPRAPRRRRGWRATSRPDDVLFGYEPLYLGAWERNRSFPTTVVPRADPRLALQTIERAAGSGAASGYSTRASGTTSARDSRSTTGCRHPRRLSKARAFGPFLVIRTARAGAHARRHSSTTRARGAARRAAARHRRRGRQPADGRCAPSGCGGATARLCAPARATRGSTARSRTPRARLHRPPAPTPGATKPGRDRGRADAAPEDERPGAGARPRASRDSPSSPMRRS